MAKFNIKDSYLGKYYESAKEKPISISGGISLLLSIIASINLLFHWIKDDTMNTILLFIPVVVFFVILLIYTPYAMYKKQRLENNKIQTSLAERPKLKPLSNRDELLRVITEARIATIGLIDNIEYLKEWVTKRPNLVNVDAMDAIKKSRIRCNNSYESMEREILVAGRDYEKILQPLYLLMQMSAILNASPDVNQSNLLTYKSLLERSITETRDKIDELSHPASSHKSI